MGDFLANGFEGFCEALKETQTPLVFCEQFDETSDIWDFSRHKHAYIELLYFLHGSAAVSTPERNVEASVYDIVIYPSGVYHTEHLQYGRHQEIFCLWLDVPALQLPRVIHMQDKDARLKWLLEQIHREYKSERPSPALINHLVKAVMLFIARSCMQEPMVMDPISRVILYMRDHLSDEISVDDMAEVIYVSKSYLSRVFKRRTGMSLMEYLRALRVETAKAMLVSSEESIEDIAYHVGFNSPKYFCRTFHKCSGMSPREFRRHECGEGSMPGIKGS